MKKVLLFAGMMCSMALTATANVEDTNFSTYKYTLLHARYYNATNCFYEAPLMYNITDEGTVTVAGADMTQKEIEIPAQVKHEGKTYKVTSIHGYAFQRCTNLETLTIPETVEYIFTSTLNDKTVYHSGPFVGCKNLKTINVRAQKAQGFWNIDARKRNLLKDIATGVTINTPSGSDYTAWAPYVDGLALNVKTNAAGFATYYINKDVQLPAGDGVSVYILKEENGEAAFVRLMEGYIPANTAVLLQAKPNSNIVLRTCTMQADKTIDVTGNLLRGFLENTAAEQSGEYFALSNTVNKENTVLATFEPVATGATLHKNEAYMPQNINLNRSAQAMIAIATGIKQATVDETNSAIYDLQGRQTKQTGKGIYIQNGKKAYRK